MFEQLTDEQWLKLEPLFPKPLKRGRGKPHAPWRLVLNSILYVLHAHAKWESLPKRETHPHLAPKSVAHRWFLRWDKEGFLTKILTSVEEFAPLLAVVQALPRRKRGPKQAILEHVLTA